MQHVDYISFKYRIITRENYKENKTAMDIFTYSNYTGEIFVIENFVVDKYYRGKRLGMKGIYDLLKSHSDKLIIIELTYMSLEKHDVLSNVEKLAQLLHLGKYFIKVGFIDINKYFGKHKNKISMCYKNEAYNNWLKSNR